MKPEKILKHSFDVANLYVEGHLIQSFVNYNQAARFAKKYYKNQKWFIEPIPIFEM